MKRDNWLPLSFLIVFENKFYIFLEEEEEEFIRQVIKQ